ncbi:hypothetical protein LUX02_14135 [Streptomyces somaliensis]|nr:hypothetical protein [Streptomyces somaliensis]
MTSRWRTPRAARLSRASKRSLPNRSSWAYPSRPSPRSRDPRLTGSRSSADRNPPAYSISRAVCPPSSRGAASSFTMRLPPTSRRAFASAWSRASFSRSSATLNTRRDAGSCVPSPTRRTSRARAVAPVPRTRTTSHSGSTRQPALAVSGSTTSTAPRRAAVSSTSTASSRRRNSSADDSLFCTSEAVARKTRSSSAAETPSDTAYGWSPPSAASRSTRAPRASAGGFPVSSR